MVELLLELPRDMYIYTSDVPKIDGGFCKAKATQKCLQHAQNRLLRTNKLNSPNGTMSMPSYRMPFVEGYPITKSR